MLGDFQKSAPYIGKDGKEHIIYQRNEFIKGI